MIFLFLGTKIGYYVGIALAAIGARMLAGVMFPQALEEEATLEYVLFSGAFLLLFLLFLSVAALLFRMIAGKKIRGIFQLLYDCDVEGYLAIYETFPGKVTKMKSEYASVLLGLSAGYLAQGKHRAAGQVLERVNYFPNNRVGVVNTCHYHNNLCIIHLRSGNMRLAAQALEQMEKALAHPKLPARERDDFRSAFTEKQTLLRMEHGDYEGAEQVFELAYRGGRPMLMKVATKYQLGRIYLHEGRVEEAHGAFSYVAAEGGSTFYKKQADRYLATGALPLSGSLEEDSAGGVALPAVEEPTGQGVFRMNRRERKRYTLVVFALFAVLFALYGWIGLMGLREFGAFGPFASPGMTVLFWGLLGGWGFTSLVGGVWLGCRYVRRRVRGAMVWVCILFVVASVVAWLFGMVVTVPFAVYNVVYLRRETMASGS